MYVEPFFHLAQAVSLHRWLVTRLPRWGPQVQFQASPCWICGGKSGTWTGIFLNNSFFFLSLSLHLCSIFIHLLLTLYNLLLTLYNHSNWKCCWIIHLKKVLLHQISQSNLFWGYAFRSMPKYGLCWLKKSLETYAWVVPQVRSPPQPHSAELVINHPTI